MTSPIHIEDMPVGTQRFRESLRLIAANPRPDIIQTAISQLSEMAKLLGYTTRAMISRLEGGSRVITPRMALTIKLLMEKHDDTLGQRT